MMPLLNQTALLLIGLLLAVWTVGACWFVLQARGRARRAEAVQRQARRLARLIDESPALPLLVRADGRIEGPSRLAGWLGFDAIPEYLSELDADDRGIGAHELAQLSEAVAQREASTVVELDGKIAASVAWGSAVHRLIRSLGKGL